MEPNLAVNNNVKSKIMSSTFPFDELEMDNSFKLFLMKYL